MEEFLHRIMVFILETPKIFTRPSIKLFHKLKFFQRYLERCLKEYLQNFKQEFLLQCKLLVLWIFLVYITVAPKIPSRLPLDFYRISTRNFTLDASTCTCAERLSKNLLGKLTKVYSKLLDNIILVFLQ